jgi:hypothetical protein
MYYLLTDKNDKLIFPDYTSNTILFRHLYDEIHDMSNSSYYIRIVNVPNNTYYYVADKSKSKWFCSSVVLSDRYYLYDPKTIKKFNIKVNGTFIKNACVNGAVEFLEWWKKSGLPLEYNEWMLIWTSCYDCIDVLEWWKNSGLELKYIESVLSYASWCGEVNVLEWWKNSGLPLKYDKSALMYASSNGHVNVLEWWKNSGLPLKYDRLDLMVKLEKYGGNVLEWWKNSGLLIN